jgi:hypothetical protein
MTTPEKIADLRDKYGTENVDRILLVIDNPESVDVLVNRLVASNFIFEDALVFTQMYVRELRILNRQYGNNY